MKRLIASTLVAAVTMASALPAAAQAYRYSEAFAPQQDEVTATVNFRVPLGATEERGSVGLTLAGTRGDAAVDTLDGDRLNSEVRIADLRFDGRGIERAQLGGYDFNAPADERLGFNDMDGKDNTTWIIIGLVVVGAVVWAVSDDDDDD